MVSFTAAATFLLALAGADASLRNQRRRLSFEVCFGVASPTVVDPIARDAGCDVAPHNFSMGPSWLASWHLAAHLTETTWLEVPWLPAGQTFPGPVPMPGVEAGTVAAPTGPGLSG